MAVIGTPRTFHHKFKFLVQIDDFAFAGFQTCSELSVEIAKIEYYEGGRLIPNKSPGRLTFSDITLGRGATSDLDLFNWLQDTVNVASGIGLIDPQFKKNLEIVQLERDDTPLRRWPVRNAWPTNFVAGDWDNEADEVVIETLTLTYDFFGPPTQ